MRNIAPKNSKKARALRAFFRVPARQTRELTDGF